MPKDPAILVEAYDYLDQRAPNLLLVLSEEGSILEANRYAHTVTGRSLIGENIRDLIVDFRGDFDLSALTDNGHKEHLLSFGTASGLPESYYLTFTRVGDYVLALGRLDADEIEHMRKEVLSLNRELSNLLRELHKTNAQLKRLNEEKNQFLGMAAHDLRKPIGLVISYSEFLIDETEEALNGEQAGFLNTIHSSSTFMKRLVDDFLDVSAIEAGQFEMDLQPASIHDALEQSLALNRLQALKRGIELKVQCDENIPRITMDAPKIEQVISNLVSNAIEHSPAESLVTISIECEREKIAFSVQDSGAGIAEEDIDKLFKPFGKLQAKKKGGEKSTGLGMLITRKIVEAHKGRIWVESQIGKGTTVSFNLPVRGGKG